MNKAKWLKCLLASLGVITIAGSIIKYTENSTIGLFLVLGSPIWISLLILVLPRWFMPLGVLLSVLQLILAVGIRWFFWGGGIGGEAHLSPLWQLTLLMAVLPFLSVAIKVRHS